jgi:AcrR family transcriptional regulator
MRADAQRNREALLAAAERLLTARGLTITLDDVAAEAGLNVATAYRHFANKQELFEAVVREEIDRAAGIVADAASNPDAEAGMRAFLTETLTLITTKRSLHDILTPGVADRWLSELDVRLEPLLSELIERGQRSGVLRSGVQPGDLGVVLQMLCAVTDIPTADPEALRVRYLELLLDGLRATGDTRDLPGQAPSPRVARESLEQEMKSRTRAAVHAAKADPARG